MQIYTLILCVSNIGASFVLLWMLAELKRRFFGLTFFNPFYVGAAFVTPILFFKLIVGPYFLLDEGLLSTSFQLAVFSENIFICSHLMATALYLHFIPDIPLSSRRYNKVNETKSLIIAEFFFLLLSLGLLVYLANNTFGLVNWILAPRTGYQHHRTGYGACYALSLAFLCCAFVLSCWRINSWKGLFIRFACYFPLVFLFGSKGNILGFVTYGISFAAFKRMKVNLPVIFAAAGGVAILLLVNLAMSYQSFGWSKIASYFDYYYNSSLYFEDYLIGNIDLFDGEIVTSDLWKYVPRRFFPEKPVVYGRLLINDFFFPGKAAAGHTPAFTESITFFGDFGWLGVLLSGVMSPMLLLEICCLKVLYAKSDNVSFLRNPIYVFCVPIVFFPFFFRYFPFGLKLVLFLGCYAIFMLIHKGIYKLSDSCR